MATRNHCLTGAALCSLALASPPAASDELSEWFRMTTQSLYDAVALGDRAVWERVLDAGCTITTEDGEVFDKVSFLQTMRPLPPGFTGRIKVRDLTLRRIQEAAVVHYWFDETEDIFGQQLRTTYVETDVYRRAAGSWKMIALHVTVVPRDLDAVAVNSADWPALVGDYRFADAATSHYEVRLRDGALYGGRDQKTATLLIPLAPLVFFQKGSIHIVVFVQDGSGAITELRELHKYNEVVMKRVATLPQPS
jgi:Domain of unknown function (DUF4440)